MGLYFGWLWNGSGFWMTSTCTLMFTVDRKASQIIFLSTVNIWIPDYSSFQMVENSLEVKWLKIFLVKCSSFQTPFENPVRCLSSVYSKRLNTRLFQYSNGWGCLVIEWPSCKPFGYPTQICLVIQWFLLIRSWLYWLGLFPCCHLSTFI
jgi:hypothetical protein